MSAVCNPENFHDTRHVLRLRVDNRIPAPAWPLDRNSFFAEVVCVNGCGLVFCCVLMNTRIIPQPE